MSTPPLACTVRDCGLLLERRDPSFLCSRGHTFDVSRHGYLNLLQPQDRRSATPGDSASAISARVRGLARGVGATIVDAAVTRVIDALGGTPAPVVVDVGCGGGDALAAIARQATVTAVGLDISTAAIQHAARHHPGIVWVVANADRSLPLLPGSVDVVLSLHGRRNPEHCARVLTPAGILVVVRPAPDDLIELRTAMRGEHVTRDRDDTLRGGHAPWFDLLEQREMRERHALAREDLLDLLRGTYRGARLSEAAEVGRLDNLEVTLAAELSVLRRRLRA